MPENTSNWRPTRKRRLLQAPLSRRMFLLGLAGATISACSLSDDDDASTADDQGTPVAEPTAPPEPTPTPQPPATPMPEPTTVPDPTATPVPEPTPEPPPAPTPTPEPAAVPEPTATPVPQSGVSLFQQLNQDPAWANAVRTPQGTIVARVANDTLNIRSNPGFEADIVGTTYNRHTIEILDVVEGDPVNEDTRWVLIGDEQYVSAALIQPFVPPEPEETYGGRWVDVNLTDFYAVAYAESTPQYGAIITAGRGERTPKGVFEILYRVRNETMDSATVGIPEGDPEYYYLEDVEYTQYFEHGGYAIHGNYWSAPANFGQFSSNGCVGLMNQDAAWFWEFLDVGSTVSIHF